MSILIVNFARQKYKRKKLKQRYFSQNKRNEDSNITKKESHLHFMRKKYVNNLQNTLIRKLSLLLFFKDRVFLIF